MNEHKTKELVQQSILRTADVFTKELMERVALRKSRAKALRNAILITCVLSGILLVVIAQVPSDFSLFRFHIKLPPLTIKITGALFAFIVLNKLLALRAALR